jgi:hypothetical protein
VANANIPEETIYIMMPWEKLEEWLTDWSYHFILESFEKGLGWVLGMYRP